MVEDNIDYEFKCPDCNWTISADEVKHKTGYKEQIFFCEQCGTKLLKWSINELEKDIGIDQNLDEKSKLFPVEIIATDPDFTVGFIDDLTLVLSRMIYVNIRMLEKSQRMNFKIIEFDETVLNFIADTIIPILKKEINPLLLKKLQNLSVNEFNFNLKKLQSKLNEIQIYRQNFIIYFRWLIKEDFFIITESWNKENLEKFDKVIIRDLKQYNFQEIYSFIEKSKSGENLSEKFMNDFPLKLSSIRNVQIENPKFKKDFQELQDLESILPIIAKQIVKDYKDEFIAARRKLGFDNKQIRFSTSSLKIDNPIVEKFKTAKTISNILEIISVKGRSKYLWYGITYIIKDINTGEYVFGITERSMNRRWADYISHVLNDDYRFGIHSNIYSYLCDSDCKFNENLYKNRDNSYNWKNIYFTLSKKFEVSVLMVHYDETQMRQSEIDLIDANRDDPKLLNKHPGGEGGNKIDIPIFSTAYHIALGEDLYTIHKLFVREGKVSCSFITFRSTLNNYFGSFLEARLKFLKPMLEFLVKNKFEKEEINSAYGRSLDSEFQTLFNGRLYEDLVKMMEEGKMDWSDLKPCESDLKWTLTVDDPDLIPSELIELIILKNAKRKDAARSISGLSVYSLGHQIYNYYESLGVQLVKQSRGATWESARKYVAFPFIIAKFKSNWIFEDIYSNVGYAKKYARKNHNKLSMQIFFGMSSLQVREWLEAHPDVSIYEEFRDTFLYEKEKIDLNRKMVPLAVLKSLICKHQKTEIASIELKDYTYGEFIDLVAYHFTKWSTARKEVVGEYLINAMRLRKDPKEICSYCDLRDHPSKVSQVYFKMKWDDAQNVIITNPRITNLSDFTEAVSELKENNLHQSSLDRFS